MSTSDKHTSKLNTGEKKALILAVSQYHNPAFEQLAFCENDGQEIYELLKSLGYDIPDYYKMIGEVTKEKMDTAIYDFFTNDGIRSEDSLIFYYSGHGVLDIDGDTYLASSEINPRQPFRKGFSFDAITKMMNRSISTRVVTILDCCYSGKAGVNRKGSTSDTAKLGTAAIENKSKFLQQGEGKCLLAASQDTQEAYGNRKENHSVFTYYLIEGLKPNKDSVDRYGNVTVDTLGSYVYNTITSFTNIQKPTRKIEAGGNIILAHYPNLAKSESDNIDHSTTSLLIYKKTIKAHQYEKDEDYESAIGCYKEAIAIDPNDYNLYNGMGYALFKNGMDEDAINAYKEALTANPEDPDAYDLIGDVYLKLEEYKRASEYYDKALNINPKSFEFLKDKGLALFKLEEYTQCITYFDKALKIKPNQRTVLRFKEDALVKLEAINRLKKRTDSSRSEDRQVHRGAIIIGINKYASDSKIQTLAGAENDAQEICERLINNGNFAVSPNHLLMGPAATREKILKAIGEIFQKQDKYDLVTFYFAGYYMIDENGVGYLAPYDMDPDNPYVSGINIEELRTVISTSENNASVIMFLDCCYAGRATQDTTRGGQLAVLDSQETRNLLAVSLKNLVESPNHTHKLDGGRGRIILASLQADEVARELKECTHLGRDDPHSHGAFSFHLIEGLDGKASDPDTGVITLGSIKRHIEEQMKKEGKRIPVYHIADASRIDSIKLAITQQQFNATVKGIIESAERYVASKTGELELPDIQSLAEAAKKVGDLASLDPTNSKIPILRKSVEDGINSYFEPTIDWFDTNKHFARLKINEIERDLYDQKLQELILGLKFDDLQKMDQNRLDTLIDLVNEIANHTEFKSTDDPRLRIFQNKIRASIRRGIYESFVKQEKSWPRIPSFIMAWGSKGTGNGQFDKPNGVAVDPLGKFVYVVEYGNNRVQKFDSNGRYITKWGGYGSASGQFNRPRNITTDLEGNYIYVTDTDHHCVQKFDSNGRYIGKYGYSLGSTDGQFNYPKGIAVSLFGQVYIADDNNHRVQMLDSNGGFIGKWGSKGKGNGQFNKPNGIAVDPTGKFVYVVEYDNHRVQKFDSNGRYITKWGSEGKYDGQFKNPKSIAVDSSGDVYVVDTNNHRVQKFDSNGGFIGKWGSEGKGDGQFDKPNGIAIDSSGNIYVADDHNHRIQKFAV